MTNSWTHNNEVILSIDDMPKTTIGFVYKITNITNNKWYIGRKLTTSAATKVVKGKKKKIRKESDWVDYWSSSPVLLAEIEEKGISNYKREILMFVNTKASLTYTEEYCLFKTGALFDPNCYNGNIRAKIMKSWFLKTPDLHNQLQRLKL